MCSEALPKLSQSFKQLEFAVEMGKEPSNDAQDAQVRRFGVVISISPDFMGWRPKACGRLGCSPIDTLYACMVPC